MGKYTQENRMIELTTPLGKDVLLLQDFSGSEGISQLFNFQLHLLSENNSIAYDKIVGQRVSISIRLADDSKRYINGFVSRFTQGRSDNRFTHYEAEVVPWPWFLTRTADCRIFQNMTIPAIITKIFNDLGFQDFKNLLGGSFETREYCVQYRETDFNFVSRLMEEEGIFYFFEHEQNKHTLVLANTPSAHKPCPTQAKTRYRGTGGGMQKEDTIHGWKVGQELKPGKFALTDYNFETPSTNLAVNLPSTVKVANNDKFEVYDYPGEYPKKAEGDNLVKVRMQELEASHLVAQGESTCRAFVSGYTTDLTDHYRRDANQGYVLTEVHHFSSVGDTYFTEGVGSGAEETYSNKFTCIPKSVPFRPPRFTPRPVVHGSQTAMVVGKSGEEIWVDKYGRVKVQFHWDREGQKNENSSCWIRVSQPWAGKQWGAMWIPRIGQEVIVDFLEGNPDQPIITGRVYNAEAMPPYTLPDHQTRSTFKSRSSKGGGGSNYNELRFEDKKDKEQFFMHAEKHMDIRVKKDSREHIGENRHLIVKKDQKELVEGNKHGEVKKNHNQKIGGDLSINVTGKTQEKTGMAYAHQAGTEIHLKAGTTVIIEAGVQISLKAAGNFVDIGPAGVAIKGTMVLINSGGAAGSGSGSSPESPEAPDQADDGSKGDKM